MTTNNYLPTYTYQSLVDDPRAVRRLEDGATVPISNVAFADFLADGGVVLPAPKPAPLNALQQIELLERANPFTHRGQREIAMAVAKIAAQLTGTDPLAQREVAILFEVDAEIVRLRDRAQKDGLIK